MELSIIHPSTFIVYGPMGSGKTHLARFIVRTMLRDRAIDAAVVISPTNDMSGDWSFLPDNWISGIYSDEVIKAIMHKQKKNPAELLLILDDCMGSAKFTSKFWTKLFTCHRHYHLSIMLICQYIPLLPMMMRDTCGYGFLFHPRSQRSIENSYNLFGQAMTKQKWFDFVMKETDEESHKCLAIARNQHEQMFPFIAPSDNARVRIRESKKK